MDMIHRLLSMVHRPSMAQLSGLLWFLFMLVPLIVLQRLLHREIQAVFLILTLIVGTLFVAYVAVYHLQMRVLWDVFRNGQFGLFWLGIRALPQVQDFYLWFYLAFAVSSTMMPSESDRHAWLELVISIGVLFAIALLVGAGPWILVNIAPRLSDFLNSVAVIFGLSAFVHTLLILPTSLIHKLLARATGVDIA